MRWLMRLIGGTLFTAIWVPTTAYCVLTHFPHTPTCPCDRCVRRRERAERELWALRAKYPHLYTPGEPLMTYEAWEEKRLDEEPLPWQKGYQRTR